MTDKALDAVEVLAEAWENTANLMPNSNADRWPRVAIRRDFDRLIEATGADPEEGVRLWWDDETGTWKVVAVESDLDESDLGIPVLTPEEYIAQEADLKAKLAQLKKD